MLVDLYKEEEEEGGLWGVAALGPGALDALRRVEEPASLALVASPPLLLAWPPPLASRLAEHLTPRQRETGLRAAQALEQAGVFFLGDGPGTGKTRVLAAVAMHFERAAPAMRRLWLVPNALLRKQALRELALLSVSAEVLSYAQLRRSEGVAASASGCLLLLDEAHALRHASEQTRAVGALQAVARAVLYSTATPASDVRRLGYMTRLRLWGPGTPFQGGFEAFVGSLTRWGLGAAELLALELKRRGLYSCHRLPEVEVRPLELSACAATRALFDACTAGWGGVAPPEAGSGSGCCPLFFKRLLTSLKVQLLAPRWRADLADGRAVVVVLQGTGAAAQQGEDGSMLQRCLRRGGRVWDADAPPLPGDALTEVRRALPGVSVGEISGRPVALRRADGDDGGGNAAALAAFQRGELRALVLSAAGAVGVNVTSPLPIRMYLVELPGVPETLAQQLGRCNRLNMQHAPEYYHASLGTVVERRVEAALARRSATLGALCCADQHQLLLRHRPWSASQIRWVTLELVTRALARRAPSAWRPPEALEDHPPPHVEDRSAAALDLGRLLADAAPGDALTRLVRCCPSAQAWALPPTWSPASHACFPAAVRRAARAAALCLYRVAGVTPMLLAHVFGYALGEDWDVAPALTALGVGGLDTATPSGFMEAAASTPLATQQALLRSCEAAALRAPVPPLALRTLASHCRRRVEHGDRYDVEVEVLAETAVECSLRVRLVARAAPVAAPVLFALASGRLASVAAGATPGGGIELRLPGKDRGVGGRTFADVAAATHAAGLRDALPPGSLQVFRAREAQELQRQRALGEAAGRVLRLVVAEPLSRWEASMRQVLAFELPPQRRLVGLLMSDRPA